MERKERRNNRDRSYKETGFDKCERSDKFSTKYPSDVKFVFRTSNSYKSSTVSTIVESREASHNHIEIYTGERRYIPPD